MARPINPQLASERRHQILLAAATVFRSRGFHGARMEEICAAAQISPGSVYRHFASKEAIIEAIVEIELAHYLQAIDQFLGSTEALKQLMTIDEASLRRLIEPHEYDVGQESWLEIMRNPRLGALAAKADTKLRKQVIKSLQRAQQAGEIESSLDAVGVGNVLMALFSGIAFDADLDPRYNLAKVATTLKILFRRFLLPHT